MIGNNLGSRIINTNYFETEMYLRFPDQHLFIRNMCDGGNTPGFRPHSGRVSPWAFPGAEKFQTELANYADSQGQFETEDQWITRLKADIIIAFFGYNESFQGSKSLENYKAELDAFIKHTLNSKYNGTLAPELVIVSPIAFENLSGKYDLPDGKMENKNLSIYTKGMKEVADQNNVRFVNAFDPSLIWFESSAIDLTIDGFQLNDEGDARFSNFLADEIFGKLKPKAEQHRTLVKAAVQEKNWMWLNDFKIPNGVEVFGRRYQPFGPDNYPAEIAKNRQMTALRDEAIWKATSGEKMNLDSADQTTIKLPPVHTNYKPGEKNGSISYLSGQEALTKFKLAPGYKVDLFASEKEFPDLAKPVQLSFDNKGRLWVATMPSYPHYRPGDQRPDDKLLILEDTDGDGKADKQTTFARGLHLPVGFEFSTEGVYAAQGTNLVLLKDTNNDDHADKKEIVLSGFDDHDSHHGIHAFCADPSGAIFMGEGVFLHTNVETPYGPVHATNGGFYRYDPQKHKLQRVAQLHIPNPWGIAFDEWGQNFFEETSGPEVRWMTPGMVKPRYGISTHKSVDLIDSQHKVRPTSGLEFVSSRHFPPQVQGDFLINNTIGFLGIKQHTLEDSGTGYKSKHRLDLIQSEDRNFRPVDLEFAPDGSLYVVDWHNILIGHMQHNARDPLRDHSHGRIYRITYPARPLIKPAKISGSSIDELLDNLKLPEYRTRYRTRRELRARNTNEVISHLQSWIQKLDKKDPKFEHHLLEALWVSWGMNKVDQNLIHQLLSAHDYRARAATVRVLNYNGQEIRDQENLLLKAANDDNGRVRLEVIIAASWLSKEAGLRILDEVGKKPLDEWIVHAYETARAHIMGKSLNENNEEMVATNLKGTERELFIKGKEVYTRDGVCMSCHQPDGNGLRWSGIPALAASEWVTGNQERLIKILLNGLNGPLKVGQQKYSG
ncbi:MAG: PVC-type heme-binding CxxCH protein, partial [Ferruginibacter sp.]